ncbi:hypothetical protein NCS52_00978900 [Fusarium sp. LHS14.1]|nr:hypothetical protein NCS52_00978900 [Fusarium sp. LHS14.1]
MPPQLSEVWESVDDWTGVTSAKERRKRQNRLHQRAYRKRKHLKAFPSSNPEPGSKEVVDASPEQLATTRRNQSQFFIALLHKLPILVIIRCPELHNNIRDFMQRAYTNWGLNFPSVCDLPGLTRLNTFDALARNALMLQIPLEYLETDDYSSIFNRLGPQSSGNQPAFPAYLAPTQLQKSVPHHSWVDLFPIPGMRDNILLGIEAGEYDEDLLCDTLCCDLLDFDANTKASLVVWGEAWDAGAWEFSPEFFKRWGMLLRGCPEVLETTNHWRQKRGEMKISYVMN